MMRRIGFLLAGAAVSLIGCEKHDTTPVCDDDCEDCQYQCSYGYAQENILIKIDPQCSEDFSSAQLDCRDYCKMQLDISECPVYNAEPIPCSGNDEGAGDTGGGMCEETTNCTNWDNRDNVYYYNGAYHVPNTLWLWLREDPSPLLDCDTGRFKLQSGGGWVADEISAGDLMDDLGFEDDDEITEIDGEPVEDFADIMEAFGTLKYEVEGGNISVEFIRNSATYTYYYTVDGPVCDDYSSASGTTYDWVDLSATGTGTGVSDDGEVNVTLPFPFPFYGEVYSQVWVGGNGAIRFNSGDVHHTNASIPTSASTSPDVALFWDDLNPDSGGDAYYYDDTANERFVISWEGVPHYSNVGEIDVQMHLYQDGRIEFHYQDGYFGNSNYDYGKSATVGIQDHVGGNTATSYRQITYNTLWETGMSSEARKFVPDCG